MKENLLEQEYWYGGCVKYGMIMPLSAESNCVLDFTRNETPNQAMPFLVSTKGRYLWRDSGFKISFNNGEMEFPDDLILKDGYNNLKGAYLAAMEKHFPFHHITPAKNLFKKVIYNTWIELTFYQNQKEILEYAQSILESGMPAGVLMIDDGWAENYGVWQFHSGKFPDAKGMIRSLHEMCFEVMVWVCPFISADTVAYRDAAANKLLIMTQSGEPYITKWWNGYSAVLDMSNHETQKWLRNQLSQLRSIGVDGFKFDAGDSLYYRWDNVTCQNVTPDEQSRLWAKFGEDYAYNEYRVTFGAGGYGLLQRLCDKEHSWGNNGIASLVPDTLLQGLTGHPYGCPDMIGGGEYLNFQVVGRADLDQELFVRHCEIGCLLPAIQFSALPFKVLDDVHFKAILNSLKVREAYIDKILQYVNASAMTGEPIIRYMCYEFPNEPVENLIDQFMLGDRYLVAPVSQKNCNGRDIYLPKGQWKYGDKMINSSGMIIFKRSIPGIPIIFEKCNIPQE